MATTGGRPALLDMGRPLNRKSQQAKGLVAWYPVLAPTGAWLPDLSGRGNHGLFADAASALAMLRFGPCFDLAAAGGYGRLPNSRDNDLSTAGSFTVTCWVQPVNAVADGAPASCFLNTPSAFSGWMIWRDAAGSYRGYINGAIRATVSGLSTGADLWYLLALSWDGATVQIDALGGDAAGLDTWQTGTGSYAVAPACGGADVIYGGYYIAGDTGGQPERPSRARVLDLRIYRNRVLGQQEIWSLFDPRTRWELYGEPEDPVAAVIADNSPAVRSRFRKGLRPAEPRPLVVW